MATPASLQTQIASGTVDSVYLVLGDDEHEKTELVAEFDSLVEEDLRVFNCDRFHGGDATIGQLLDAARTMPMMAARRLVVVSRAERLLEPARESQAATRDAEALAVFVESPPPHVVLVLVSGRLDERRKLTKRLLANATVVRVWRFGDGGRCSTLDPCSSQGDQRENVGGRCSHAGRANRSRCRAPQE